MHRHWKLAALSLALCFSSANAKFCCKPEILKPQISYLATIYENPCINFFGGFYLGANIGYRWGANQLKIEGTPPSGIDRNHKSALGTTYRLGYGHAYEAFFLAGEVAYQYRSREQDSTYNVPGFFVMGTTPILRNRITTDIQGQHAVDIDILPGFVVTPRTLLFARLGVEYARHTWIRSFSFTEVLNPENPPPDTILVPRELRSTDSETNYSARLGLGIARAVTQHVSVDLNYIYSISSNLQFQVRTTPRPIENSESGIPPALIAFARTKNTIRPNRNEVNIGVTIRL